MSRPIQLGKRPRELANEAWPGPRKPDPNNGLLGCEPDRQRVKLDLKEEEDPTWAKLSSITTQTTRSIPISKLKLKGSEFKIGRNDLNDLQILNPLVSG